MHIKKLISMNRIEKIIMFNKLTYDNIKTIVIKYLNYYIDKLNVDYVYDNSIVENIIKETNYETYGARKIERIVKDKIDTYILEKMNNKVEIN